MAHPVGWFEVVGKDQQKLTAFYTGLFGWKAEPVPGMPYSIVEAEDGGIAGGIGATPDGSAGHVTWYVEAADPQATLDRAVSLGGTVVMPVTELPMTTIALFADPEGHVIGLYKGQ